MTETPRTPLDVERLVRIAADTAEVFPLDDFIRRVAFQYDSGRLSESGSPPLECPDPDHPDGAYCANTTGLHTCYSKAEHDADNLLRGESGSPTPPGEES